jgi:hypothetical protein
MNDPFWERSDGPSDSQIGLFTKEVKVAFVNSPD